MGADHVHAALRVAGPLIGENPIRSRHGLISPPLRRHVACAATRPQGLAAMSKTDALEDLSKVPAVTLGFWIIKILATTLGETAGDTVSMTMKLGYLAGTAIFMGALIVLVVAQVRARKFHPFLYWATIIASTTAGTSISGRIS